MSRSAPRGLERLREDLDLRRARSQPTALARLVLVILWLHANEDLITWPGVLTLVRLTRSDESSVHRALGLLEARGAIVRLPGHRYRWRVVLASDLDDSSPGTKIYIFWPEPPGPRRNKTLAFEALVAEFSSRTRIAAMVMLYQFGRQPEIPGLLPDHPDNRPRVPWLAWIARVLCTSVDTVAKAKKDLMAAGLAVQDSSGLLVFEDPSHWTVVLAFRKAGFVSIADASGTGKPANQPARHSPLDVEAVGHD